MKSEQVLPANYRVPQKRVCPLEAIKRWYWEVIHPRSCRSENFGISTLPDKSHSTDTMLSPGRKASPKLKALGPSQVS